MDIINIPELLAQYKPNCDTVNELALNTLAKIEIPVFNTLCSMSKQSILSLLYIFPEKIKTLKTTEKSLMITLITDVITCMIKYKEFYGFLESKNTYILDVLYRRIKDICLQVKKDEVQTLVLHINQMINYAARIPDCPDFMQRLKAIRFIDSKCTTNFILYKNILPNMSASLKNSTNNNENILKECNTTNVLKRKYSETKTENIKRKKTANKQENRNIQNDIKLPKIKPETIFNTCSQGVLEPKTILDKKVVIAKLPRKQKNAFDVLMISTKNNKTMKTK